MAKIPAPRLLPTTIAVLGALFTLKCGVLLQVAVSHGQTSTAVIVAAANAASTDQTTPVPKPPTGNVPPIAPPKAVAPAPPRPLASQAPPPVSEPEKALLQSLRQRRQELDARAASLAARESILAATDQKLAARVTELQALQQKLEGLDAAQRQKEEAGWQGLVKLYESMKPKDAATIFNDLSMPVMLQLVDRMKDAKAASIMAAMNPDRARDLTSDLAHMRTGRDASGAPVAIQKDNSAGG